MKSARHQLILLGFIGQGLSWENYWLTLGTISIWFLALTVGKRLPRLPEAVELLLMVAGAAGSVLISRSLGASSHFFIGHGLIILQATRLLRPLSRREQVISVVIALIHISAACTYILDYRFIPILFATLILLPGTFSELESQNNVETETRAPVRFSSLGFKFFFGLSAWCVLLFLVAPRFAIGSGMRGQFGSRQGAPGDSMDPFSGGETLSSKTILQIYGEEIGYLRSVVLSVYDGESWSRNPAARSHPVPREGPRLSNFLARKVRVKNVSYLNRGLPVDGFAMALKGNFVIDASMDLTGTVTARQLMKMSVTEYEFWTKPGNLLPAPNASWRELLIRHPPFSPRVTQWAEELLSGTTNQWEKAQRLTRYLREELSYEIGSPRLNRLNPVDDFLFQQKRGHCERFASTLALLLRMQKIPSRVVLGYVPAKSWMSGWNIVRFKDGHAWTEAYFDELGWVTLDATPRTSSVVGSEFSLSDWADQVDLFWISAVVNFDGISPQMVWRSAERFSGTFSQLFSAWKWGAGALVIVLSLLFVVGKLRKRTTVSSKQRRNHNQQVVENFYQRMLVTLGKRGIYREPWETPSEFIAKLEVRNSPYFREILSVTRVFTRTFYGNEIPDEATLMEIQAWLRGIEEAPGPAGSLIRHG